MDIVFVKVPAGCDANEYEYRISGIVSSLCRVRQAPDGRSIAIATTDAKLARHDLEMDGFEPSDFH